MATNYNIKTMDRKYKISMMGNFGKSYGQTCDENFIKDALGDLGHEVFENQIVSNVDLILMFKSNKYGVQHVKEWRTKTNAPVFILSFDFMKRFEWFFPIAKECDLWLGEEEGLKEEWKQRGLPFYQFPNHAVNPKVFYPMDLLKEYDVSFFGTPYFQERTDMLKAIENAGFNLYIFGNNPSEWKQHGFKNVMGSAFDEKLSEMVAKSRIVVGISNTLCEGYYSIRPSQVMLCKGFMIDRFCPYMEKELKDGCEYWNTHEELIEKIRYYLEHENERLAIAEKGYQIAINNLTNKQRCKELVILFERFKQLGKEKFLQICNQ